MTEVKIRPAKGSDIAFIYSTWLNSYRNDSSIGLSVRKSVFFDNYQLILDQLMDSSETIIACQPDEENVVYGFMTFDPKTIHYAFVKEAFRRLGIAKSLFQYAFTENLDRISITHKTKYAQFLCTKFNYNPFQLYLKGE